METAQAADDDYELLKLSGRSVQQLVADFRQAAPQTL